MCRATPREQTDDAGLEDEDHADARVEAAEVVGHGRQGEVGLHGPARQRRVVVVLLGDLGIVERHHLGQELLHEVVLYARLLLERGEAAAYAAARRGLGVGLVGITAFGSTV